MLVERAKSWHPFPFIHMQFASKLLSPQPPLVMDTPFGCDVQRQQGDSDSDEHTKQAL